MPKKRIVTVPFLEQLVPLFAIRLTLLHVLLQFLLSKKDFSKTAQQRFMAVEFKDINSKRRTRDLDGRTSHQHKTCNKNVSHLCS
jgi:hypothetical protein